MRTLLLAALLLVVPGCTLALWSTDGDGLLNDPPRLYCKTYPDGPASTADSLSAGCWRGEDRRPSGEDVARFVVGTVSFWSAVWLVSR